MTDFSSATRIVVALVLVLVSFVVWRWMQTASTKGNRAATVDKKKPSKKKPTKKKKKTAAADAAVSPSTATAETTATATSATRTTSVVVDDAATNMSNNASDDDDSDDEDAGLTAKQILARRRFKPKAIGGQAAATRAAATAEAVSAARFQAGQRVVARFQDGPEWFPGAILEVRRGNEYHIKYDDGEVELHVPHARIQDEAAVIAAKKDAEEAKDSPEATLGARLNTDVDDEGEGSESSSDIEDDEGETSEDGWQVVEKKRRAVGTSAAAADVEKVDAEGLTKRQRENRRKKERKKEVKEMARAQAQEQGLHARWGGTMTRLKYVPPPTGATKPT